VGAGMRRVLFSVVVAAMFVAVLFAVFVAAISIAAIFAAAVFHFLVVLIVLVFHYFFTPYLINGKTIALIKNCINRCLSHR
jgi:hypothetical protein